MHEPLNLITVNLKKALAVTAVQESSINFAVFWQKQCAALTKIQTSDLILP